MKFIAIDHSVFTFMDHGMSRIVAVIARTAEDAVQLIISERLGDGVIMDASALEFIGEAEIAPGIVVDSEVQP